MEVPVAEVAKKIEESEFGELKTSLRGTLVRPTDSDYEQARKVWNGMIDKHPALIVQCSGASDVIKAVNFARKHSLPVAVRGCGHNVSGNAVCDAGLVIDFSRMKSVRVDPLERIARVEPGANWGDFDREAQTFGLAVTGGIVSTTGVAGFTLGGGLGWMMRKHGLTLDNLISADVVTAKGEFLTASRTKNQDLFWGLRGGGGNFGVATSFEFKLHPIGPIVYGGMLVYPKARAKELLRFYREFMTRCDDEVCLFVVLRHAPPAPFIPQQLHGTPVIIVAGMYTGRPKDGEKAIRPLKSFGEPIADFMKPIPYTTIQSLTDKANLPGFQNYWKSEYLRDLSDEAIDTIVTQCASMTSPLTYVGVGYLKGAVARVAKDETAYFHREAPYFLNIVTMWSDPAESDKHIRWSRGFWSAMQRFSSGGVYVNFLGQEGDDRVLAAYGSNYARLRRLKDKYDSRNFFRFNQNIKPTVK